jgi:hypothetical protein
MAPGEQKVDNQSTDSGTVSDNTVAGISGPEGEQGTPGDHKPKGFNLADFVRNGKRIRQDRINRVREKFQKLGLKAHAGTTHRVAMDRPLTATQFYRLQSQMPAQVAYALTDARTKIQEQEIVQADVVAREEDPKVPRPGREDE